MTPNYTLYITLYYFLYVNMCTYTYVNYIINIHVL